MLGRQSGDQHTIGELPVRFPAAHRDALDRAHIGAAHFRHPAELPLGLLGIREPVLHRAGQAFSLLARIVFPMHLIAASQQPIDISQTPATCVEAHNGAAALACIQLQGLFCR